MCRLIGHAVFTLCLTMILVPDIASDLEQSFSQLPCGL